MKKSFQFALILGTLMTMALLAGACSDDSGPKGLPGTPDSGIVLPMPDAAPAMSCDPLAQNCTAATDKCSLDLTQSATAATWGESCRPQTGMVAAGAMCARSMEGAPGVGKDNCAKGLYCTAIGNFAADTSAAARVCRTFCRSNSQCTVGTHPACFQLTAMRNPDTGFCVDSCNILADDGICTGGTWCEPSRSMEGQALGLCSTAGTAAVGETCGGMPVVDCQKGSVCITTNSTMMSACAAWCDIVADPTMAKFPCPANFTCKAFGNGPTDFGICSAN